MVEKIHLGGIAINVASKGKCNNFISLTDLETRLGVPNLINDWLRNAGERWGLIIYEWLKYPGAEVEVLNQVSVKFSCNGNHINSEAWVMDSGTNEMFIKQGEGGGVYASLAVTKLFLNYLKQSDLWLLLRAKYEALTSYIATSRLNKVMSDFVSVSSGRAKKIRESIEPDFLDIEGYESIEEGYNNDIISE